MNKPRVDSRRFFRLVAQAAIAALALMPIPSLTQPATSPTAPVVTTKILAIGHATTTATPDAVRAVLPGEVRETVRLYLLGKIDQWYVRQDQNGVVFLMNVTSVADARTILEKLPLGQNKLMEFDYVPLGPLSPLGVLLPK